MTLADWPAAGRDDAHAAIAYLKEQGFDHIYTLPLDDPLAWPWYVYDRYIAVLAASLIATSHELDAVREELARRDG